MRRPALITSTLVIAMLATVACNQRAGNFELGYQPTPTKMSPDAKSNLVVPSDEPFAIAETSMQTDETTGGTAAADTSISEQGSAKLETSAANGGQASAAFQLGHSVRNAGNEQAQVTLTVAFDYEYAVVEEPPAGLPDASVSLELIIRNRRERVLDRITLLDYSTEQQSGSEKSRKQFQTECLCPVNDTLDIFLAGSVKSGSQADTSASANLTLRNVELRFAGDFAPPVTKSANDE
jgi:hypothetical protein